MPLTINTNMAASRASYFLSKNNDLLQKSLDRLSSGKKITEPADDAGGLAVAMKMEGEIDSLNGAANNVANAISFLQVQDGILDSVAQIVGRMSELKSLTSDVLKSPDDIATYNSEFGDLQKQLYDLSTTQFNGVNLFDATTEFETNAGVKNSFATNPKIIGAGGVEIEISQSLLLSGLSVNTVYTGGTYDAAGTYSDQLWLDAVAVADDSAGTQGLIHLARNTQAATTLDKYNSGVFTKALENVATMRATNGGEAKRLQFEQDNIANQSTNMEAALGRILDVDIAAETANLAKHQILVQASAAMVAQANTANNIALMLLQ